jgi:hypothetical protein
LRKEKLAVHRVWRVVRRWKRGMANTLKMAEVYAIHALLERGWSRRRIILLRAKRANERAAARLWSLRMTSREIVKRAITFQNPPRLPMKFDIVGVNDCYDVWTPDPTGWEWTFKGERLADEWGCVWGKTAVSNTGQVVEHPLSDITRLKSYQWPDPDDPRWIGSQHASGGMTTTAVWCSLVFTSRCQRMRASGLTIIRHGRQPDHSRDHQNRKMRSRIRSRRRFTDTSRTASCRRGARFTAAIAARSPSTVPRKRTVAPTTPIAAVQFRIREDES